MIRKIFLFVSIVVLLFVACFVISIAQIPTPYNLNFELGSEDSEVFGWTLGKNATEKGYNATTSEANPAAGLACAKITNTTKTALPKDKVGSFYQRIKAKYYLDKKIRFSAFVKTGELQSNLIQRKDDAINPADYIFTAPVLLFMNAKDINGVDIARNSEIIGNRRGWDQFSIELDIPPNADDITFGVNFSDTNDIYIDQCKIEIISNDSIHYSAASPLTITELMYLVPLANIAGQVQYFHPSKNALAAKWDKVLLNAMTQMKSINEQHSKTAPLPLPADSLNRIVLDSLRTFFMPYCPSLEMDNTPSTKTNFVLPKHIHLLSWIHSGVPNNTDDNLTISQLVDLNSPLKYTEAVVVQHAEINEDTGSEILLSVKTKLNKYHKNATASISIRFENTMGAYISFLKKDITNEGDWTAQQLAGAIPKNATRALIILGFKGYGKCYFDDVNLYHKNSKDTIPFVIQNGGFERSLPFDQNNWMTTNETRDNGYQIAYEQAEPANGKQSLSIFTGSAVPIFPSIDSNIISITANHILHNDFVKTLFPNDSYITQNIKPIFVALPRFVAAELFFDTTVKGPTDTLFKQQKLTNYETYPIATTPITWRSSKTESFNLTWQDRDSRFVFIIHLYNIAKMFNVLDVVDSNKRWNTIDSLLVTSLIRSAECNEQQQFLSIINDMLQVFDDARTRAWINDNTKGYSIPINWELDNDKLYVTQVDEAYKKFIASGSEIIKINGQSIEDILDANNEALLSKQYFKLIKLKLGELYDKLDVTIEHNGDTINLPLEYNTLPNKLIYRATDYWQPINDSIVYIDLSAYSDKDIYEAFDSLKRYKHWIFDIRNEIIASEFVISLYANNAYQSSQSIIPYWTSDKIQGTTVAQLIPPSKSKRIDGKVLFLTNWKTYGRAELLAAAVKQQKEGVLIGGSTQGATISATAIKLGEDFGVSIPTELGFTPAGVSIYGNPIQPDIVVRPTPDNVHQDYILEAAIRFLTAK